MLISGLGSNELTDSGLENCSVGEGLVNQEGLVLLRLKNCWQHLELSEREDNPSKPSHLHWLGQTGGWWDPVGEGLWRERVPLRCQALWCHVTCKSNGGSDTGSAIAGSGDQGTMSPLGYTCPILHSGQLEPQLPKMTSLCDLSLILQHLDSFHLREPGLNWTQPFLSHFLYYSRWAT